MITKQVRTNAITKQRGLSYDVGLWMVLSIVGGNPFRFDLLHTNLPEKTSCDEVSP